MSIFRYIVQGIGWEIGSQVARDGIDHVKEKAAAAEASQPAPLTEKEKAKLAKERAKQEAREQQAREAEIAKKRAEIDAQLAELKKKAGR